MRTLLIFPPGWSPHAPYLALPLLAANLRQAGHPVDVFDANIDFLANALSSEYLQRMADRLEARPPGSDDPSGVAATVRLLAADLCRNITAAKAGLRSQACFDDREYYAWCRRTVAAALQLVSAAHPGLSYRLYGISFPAWPPSSTAGVLGAVADATANPFISYAAERLAPLVSERGHRLVGLSVTERDQLVPALTIAQALRRAVGPELQIVFGGNYFTRIARTWTEPHPFHRIVDYTVIGEGESALVELVEALSGARPLSSVSNLMYSADGQLRLTESRSVPMEQTPFADFDDLPLDQYLAPALILPTYATRSCSWNRCAFCTIAGSSGSFRVRPADRVAAELAYLQQRHGTALFTFVDETLAPGVVRNVARAILGRGLDVRWYGETRLVPGFTALVLAEASRAGLRLLQFGLESYNQRVLDCMGKGVREADILPILRRCLENDIAFHLFCMVGFPSETRAEAARTLAFADQVLQMAADEYANPCCSKGIGTFGLEYGSPIQQAPERFGVTIEPRLPERDLALDMSYRVAAGMDAAAAADLLERYTGADLYRAVAERRGDVFPNRRMAPDAPREEETFIRWVTRQTPDIAGVQRLAGAAGPSLPGAPPLADQVRLVRQCGNGDHAGLAVSAWRCAVHRLSAAQFDLLARHQAGAAAEIDRRALIDLAVGRELARLAFLDLVEAPPALCRHRHTPAAIASGHLLPFAEVEFMVLSDASCVLFDRQQEKIIRLNESGAFIWLLLGTGMPGSELLHRIQLTFGPAMTADHLAAFINRLTAAGMLAVHPGAPA